GARAGKTRPRPEVARRASPPAAHWIRRYSSSRRASSSAASAGSRSSRSASPAKSPRALSSSSAATSTRNSPHASRSSSSRSASRSTNASTIPATSTSTSGSSSRRTRVRSRSNGPSNASRSSSSSRTLIERRTLVSGSDAATWNRHLRPAVVVLLRGAAPPPPKLPAEELPPDEERGRKDEQDQRHPGVQPQAGDVVGGIDPQQLFEEAPEGVEGDVEREQPGRADPPAPVDQEQHPDHRHVVDQLVEEGRVERRVLLVPRHAVVDVDLEPPRQVGRLPVQLLVEPVADPPDALREEQAGRRRVHHLRHAFPRALDDDRAHDAAEEDPAPDAEAALPDLEHALPLRIGNL